MAPVLRISCDEVTRPLCWSCKFYHPGEDLYYLRYHPGLLFSMFSSHILKVVNRLGHRMDFSD